MTAVQFYTKWFPKIGFATFAEMDELLTHLRTEVERLTDENERMKIEMSRKFIQ